MNNKPFFSVIIPTYNSATKLKRALLSLLDQTFKNFEVIVCDDGSTDNTKKIVGDFNNILNISYAYNEHWGGPAKPRNNGIRLAKSEYIAFLDSDDWWYPKKLDIIKKNTSNYDFLFHDLDIYTPKGKKIFKKVKGRYLRRPVFIDLMLNENAIITSSVVVRKEILDKVGGFSEDNLKCVEDFDLWLKISRLTERFNYINESLGGYWIENTSVSIASDKIADTLTYVYNHFSTYLNDKNKREASFILNYLIGKTYFKIGKYNDAAANFALSIKSRKFKYKIRSLAWFLLIIFRPNETKNN